MTDRDAAPAAAADTWEAACAFVEHLHAEWESDPHSATIGTTIEFVLRELRAARPAPAAAPREGVPLLVACIERVARMKTGLEDPGNAYYDALTVVLDAAREAARGDGAEGWR